MLILNKTALCDEEEEWLGDFYSMKAIDKNEKKNK